MFSWNCYCRGERRFEFQNEQITIRRWRIRPGITVVGRGQWLSATITFTDKRYETCSVSCHVKHSIFLASQDQSYSEFILQPYIFLAHINSPFKIFLRGSWQSRRCPEINFFGWRLPATKAAEAEATETTESNRFIWYYSTFDAFAKEKIMPLPNYSHLGNTLIYFNLDSGEPKKKKKPDAPSSPIFEKTHFKCPGCGFGIPAREWTPPSKPKQRHVQVEMKAGIMLSYFWPVWSNHWYCIQIENIYLIFFCLYQDRHLLVGSWYQNQGKRCYPVFIALQRTWSRKKSSLTRLKQSIFIFITNCNRDCDCICDEIIPINRSRKTLLSVKKLARSFAKSFTTLHRELISSSKMKSYKQG